MYLQDPLEATCETTTKGKKKKQRRRRKSKETSPSLQSTNTATSTNDDDDATEEESCNRQLPPAQINPDEISEKVIDGNHKTTIPNL